MNYSLPDGSFMLDGLEFGRADSSIVVLTNGLDVGEWGVRSQDAPSPLGDSTLMGRDFLSPPSWEFTMLVRDDENVYTTLGSLAKVWRGDSVRGTPGAVSALAYARAGETRVVFGRPRKFSVEPQKVHNNRYRVVKAEFVLADPLSYSGTEHSLVLDLITTNTTGGLVLPAVLPWALQLSTTERRGIVNINSLLDVPFKVHLRGPVAGQAADFTLSGSDWAMKFTTTLSANGNILVDTARGTVIRNSAPAGGVLSVDSTVTARLSPGVQELVFTADDPSASTYATVTWRTASPVY